MRDREMFGVIKEFESWVGREQQDSWTQRNEERTNPPCRGLISRGLGIRDERGYTSGREGKEERAGALLARAGVPSSQGGTGGRAGGQAWHVCHLRLRRCIDPVTAVLPHCTLHPAHTTLRLDRHDGQRQVSSSNCSSPIRIPSHLSSSSPSIAGHRHPHCPQPTSASHLLLPLPLALWYPAHCLPLPTSTSTSVPPADVPYRSCVPSIYGRRHETLFVSFFLSRQTTHRGFVA